MVVLLPDRMLAVRRRDQMVVDAHGSRVVSSWGALEGPWPGRAVEQGDVPLGDLSGRTWTLALDPAAWPLLPDDLVEEYEGDGRQWLVTSARLVRNSAAPDVDYVTVEAHIRVDGFTRP